MYVCMYLDGRIGKHIFSNFIEARSPCSAYFTPYLLHRNNKIELMKQEFLCFPNYRPMK